MIVAQRHRQQTTNSFTKRVTTLVLWAIAWAATMIASAILLKGNPIKDWIQAVLFIGAMTSWEWQSQHHSKG